MKENYSILYTRMRTSLLDIRDVGLPAYETLEARNDNPILHSKSGWVSITTYSDEL